MARHAIALLFSAAIFLATTQCAVAAPPDAPAAAPSVSDRQSQIRVYVLTFGPGDDAWEKFGHNAIRVVDDTVSGPWHDVAFNWGTFEFDDSFYWNFLQGRLNYSLDAELGQQTIDAYAKADRTVRQQELNLSLEQKRLLLHKLSENYKPENRHYRYDYYRDNCSSRIRDIIDEVSGGSLGAVSKGIPSGTTYRWHTRRLDQGTPWLYVALQAVLGQPVDRPIDEWNEMFLPEKLYDRLAEAKTYLNGARMPLVKSDQTLYASHRAAEPARPATTWPWFLAAGVALAGAFATTGHFARRHWAARWGLVALSTPWLLLMALGGIICGWAWFCTDHVVARHNENLMHVSILALPLLLGMPMLAFGRRRWANFFRNCAALMVAISALGLLLKALPWFFQVNFDIIALCLPANAALALVAWKLAEKPAPEIPVKNKARTQ